MEDVNPINWGRDGYGHTSNNFGGTGEGFYRYDTIDAGIFHMINDLEKMGRDVDEPVTEALCLGADIIVASQKALVPVDKKTLFNAIERWKPYKNKLGKITVRCGIDFHKFPEALHAIYQEFGRVGGTNKNGKEVGHMKAQPFIRPGFEFAKDRASDIVVNAFNKIIDKIWGGG